jgi:hypothetical protein
VVVEWDLIESMFQSPGVAVVMVGMDNLHCLLRDNVRYGENITEQMHADVPKLTSKKGVKIARDRSVARNLSLPSHHPTVYY